MIIKKIAEDYRQFYYSTNSQFFDIWYTLLKEFRDCGKDFLSPILIHGINLELKDKKQDFRIGPGYVLGDSADIQIVDLDLLGIYVSDKRKSHDGIKKRLDQAMEELRDTIRTQNILK